MANFRLTGSYFQVLTRGFLLYYEKDDMLKNLFIRTESLIVC